MLYFKLTRFQTQSPSFHGLLALCALGLLQEDLTLATAVIGELSKRSDSERLSVQAALLQLYAHFIQVTLIQRLFIISCV